jgi:hypothetical protein
VATAFLAGLVLLEHRLGTQDLGFIFAVEPLVILPAPPKVAPRVQGDDWVCRPSHQVSTKTESRTRSSLPPADERFGLEVQLTVAAEPLLFRLMLVLKQSAAASGASKRCATAAHPAAGHDRLVELRPSPPGLFDRSTSTDRKNG